MANQRAGLALTPSGNNRVIEDNSHHRFSNARPQWIELGSSPLSKMAPWAEAASDGTVIKIEAGIAGRTLPRSRLRRDRYGFSSKLPRSIT